MMVILHNVRSIYNVASIFRTGDAAGVKKIYLTGLTPAPLNRFDMVRPDFAKVSLGAEKYIPWEKASGAAPIIKKLKMEGYKILAVEQAKNSIPYYKIPQFRALNPKFCLVLGSEVRGLQPSILKLADKILEIPMRGKKESLNVSVAFGIVAFTLLYG